MPRLTDSDYLHHRQLLAEAWVNQDFACLPVLEQLELLDYYRPADRLTDEDALVHRRDITERDPSLP